MSTGIGKKERIKSSPSSKAELHPNLAMNF